MKSYQNYQKVILIPESSSKSSSIISSIAIVVTMVLLTAVGVSIFTFLKVFVTPNVDEKFSMQFHSQTYFPERNFYLVTIAIDVPSDLIDDDKFILEVCDEFQDEIEDGFTKINPNEIYAAVDRYKIVDFNSIQVYYQITYDNGELENKDEIFMACYLGWEKFELRYKKMIERFRKSLPLDSEKYKVVSEDETEVKFENDEVVEVNRNENVKSDGSVYE